MFISSLLNSIILFNDFFVVFNPAAFSSSCFFILLLFILLFFHTGVFLSCFLSCFISPCSLSPCCSPILLPFHPPAFLSCCLFILLLFHLSFSIGQVAKVWHISRSFLIWHCKPIARTLFMIFMSTSRILGNILAVQKSFVQTYLEDTLKRLNNLLPVLNLECLLSFLL